MVQSNSGKIVHIVRLGTAAVALHWYLAAHDDDAVSWTSDLREAIPFLTQDAAKRYAARRLGGAWHVAQVDRDGFRSVTVDEEIDELLSGDVGREVAPSRAEPLATILTREQGDALAAHRRAIRLRASSPWAA